MELHVIQNPAGNIAVLQPGAIIHTAQDALDLLATATYTHGCDKLIIPKECLPEAFFDLKTGLAGEVLQKFTNYQMRLAITGDFSGYQSTALRDFIRESNRGGAVAFVPSETAAIQKLASQL